MIVACSACRTRFRVADEKVGPLGARVKCSRCGQTFQVAPPPPAEPPPVPPEPTPEYRPEPAPVPTEPTGTGGWPTGVLEVAGGASDSSVGLALEADPFAAYATQSAPAGPPPVEAPPPPREADFLGSLPVTDLSDLERTGARFVAPAYPPTPDPSVEDGLALEERTPSATPVRDAAARWSDPDASQAIAVGADGFQEVDLASGAAPPDPEFDALAGEATSEIPFHPPPPPSPAPAEPEAPRAAPTPEGAPQPPAGALAPEPTSALRVQPARARALAMNVLSLAALLLVTLGIVLWWRGDGLGALLRWPRGGHADIDVGSITSGVYEGSHGKPVIFVRGVVRAAHEGVEGPVTVRVVLERGGARLAAATATAGVVPSAEELASVTSSDGLLRLQQQSDARAPPRLVPGGDLPFLAVLPLPEGDVGTLQFRVETLPVRGP